MRQVMADERAAEQAAADALAAGLAPPENVVNAAPISKEDLKKLQNLLYELRLEGAAHHALQARLLPQLHRDCARAARSVVSGASWGIIGHR